MQRIGASNLVVSLPSPPGPGRFAVFLTSVMSANTQVGYGPRLPILPGSLAAHHLWQRLECSAKRDYRAKSM